MLSPSSLLSVPRSVAPRFHPRLGVEGPSSGVRATDATSIVPHFSRQSSHRNSAAALLRPSSPPCLQNGTEFRDSKIGFAAHFSILAIPAIQAHQMGAVTRSSRVTAFPNFEVGQGSLGRWKSQWLSV